ncbi:hypothetical protein BASA81_000303 [Batrachochytrium salamandrivorans]|nr:hypothetical protein BASA81_000303 [Batrachochytrium salamandrivorans]
MDLTQEAEIRAVFRELVGSGKYLDSPAASRVLSQSDLPITLLERIWEMSDVDKDGKLTESEFVVAFHLCVCVSKRGLLLPRTLPVKLQQVLQKPAQPQRGQPATKFAKGDLVEHKRKSDGLVRGCVVVGVHLDDVVNGVYYTLRTDATGAELQSQEGNIALPGGWKQEEEEEEDGFASFVAAAAAPPPIQQQELNLFGQVSSVVQQPVLFPIVQQQQQQPLEDEDSFGDFTSPSPALPQFAPQSQLDVSFGDFAGFAPSPQQQQQFDVSFGNFTAPSPVGAFAPPLVPAAAPPPTFSSFLAPMPAAIVQPKVARPVSPSPILAPVPAAVIHLAAWDEPLFDFDAPSTITPPSSSIAPTTAVTEEENASSLLEYSASSFIPDTSMLVESPPLSLPPPQQQQLELDFDMFGFPPVAHLQTEPVAHLPTEPVPLSIEQVAGEAEFQSFVQVEKEDAAPDEPVVQKEQPVVQEEQPVAGEAWDVFHGLEASPTIIAAQPAIVAAESTAHMLADATTSIEEKVGPTVGEQDNFQTSESAASSPVQEPIAPEPELDVFHGLIEASPQPTMEAFVPPTVEAQPAVVKEEDQSAASELTAQEQALDVTEASPKPINYFAPTGTEHDEIAVGAKDAVGEEDDDFQIIEPAITSTAAPEQEFDVFHELTFSTPVAAPSQEEEDNSPGDFEFTADVSPPAADPGGEEDRFDFFSGGWDAPSPQQAVGAKDDDDDFGAFQS